MGQKLLGFVGDLLINRPEPDEVFRHVARELRSVDLLFGNLEGAYTDAPHPAPGQSAMVSGPSAALNAYARVGFNILSMANNHILDVGCEAMLENRQRLRDQGLFTCGAGHSLEDASRPAIAGTSDLRIAYLAYASIFPYGYEAGLGLPGLVPIRAYDLWRPAIASIHMPGARPAASTVPDDRDLERLARDLDMAREQADLVVASFHWGDQTRPYHLTDHEKRTARFAIDRGADMVVGHHHHAIRGVEWYRGKPILYGLGHFVFDFRLEMDAETLGARLAEISPGGYWDAPYVVAPQEGWPFLPMHEDTRMTMLAWALAGKSGVSEIGFLPSTLTPDGAVHFLDPDTDAWDRMLAYFDTCNTTQGLAVRVVTEQSGPIKGRPTVRVFPAGLRQERSRK